jgi:hypothetical protein
MVAAKKEKLSTKKAIADAKREAKAAKQAADFEKSKAAMSPQNRQHFDKVMAAKNKPKSAVVAAPKVALSAEREQQLADWKQKESADAAVLHDWGQRLAVTRKKVLKLQDQYRDLLYKFLQEAYEVYKEVEQHELAESFFYNVRGVLKKLDIKVQSNTPDAALIVRLVFGNEASNKSVSEYSKVLDAALSRGVKADSFAEWLKKETLSKVVIDQRAAVKELETPTDKLDRARRLILKLMDTRDAVPMFTLDTTAHKAEKYIGRSYGLCVALGHANRKMDRESFYAEIRFSLIMPVSLDFEIYIVDKLARYVMPNLTRFERMVEEESETVWADQMFENLVAACEAEVAKNNEYWSIRQQAALAEDQFEFAKLVKERKKAKK